MQASELHRQFREQTKHQHSRLDSLEVLGVFKGKSDSIKDYMNALENLYRPHVYLEMLVDKSISQLSGYDYQPRCSLLLGDLKEMNSGFNADSEPKLVDMPSINVESALGYLYLLEGSKLGSRHISKLLDRQFNGAIPTQFINQDDLAEFDSSEFWEFMSAKLQTNSAIDQAIKAAQNAFEFYITLASNDALDTAGVAENYLFNA